MSHRRKFSLSCDFLVVTKDKENSAPRAKCRLAENRLQKAFDSIRLIRVLRNSSQLKPGSHDEISISTSSGTFDVH
jgi:formylmethanofuran dehydrogenase subunit B